MLDGRHIDMGLDKGGFTDFIRELRAQWFLGAEYE